MGLGCKVYTGLGVLDWYSVGLMVAGSQAGGRGEGFSSCRRAVGGAGLVVVEG